MYGTAGLEDGRISVDGWRCEEAWRGRKIGWRFKDFLFGRRDNCLFMLSFKG